VDLFETICNNEYNLFIYLDKLFHRGSAVAIVPHKVPFHSGFTTGRGYLGRYFWPPPLPKGEHPAMYLIPHISFFANCLVMFDDKRPGVGSNTFNLSLVKASFKIFSRFSQSITWKVSKNYTKQIRTLLASRSLQVLEIAWQHPPCRHSHVQERCHGTLSHHSHVQERCHGARPPSKLYFWEFHIWTGSFDILSLFNTLSD